MYPDSPNPQFWDPSHSYISKWQNLLNVLMNYRAKLIVQSSQDIMIVIQMIPEINTSNLPHIILCNLKIKIHQLNVWWSKMMYLTIFWPSIWIDIYKLLSTSWTKNMHFLLPTNLLWVMTNTCTSSMSCNLNPKP